MLFQNTLSSYTASSSLIYPIGFNYSNQSEVKVRTLLSTGIYQEVTNWNFLGTTSIQFTSTPPTTFEIYRASDLSRSYGTPGYAVFIPGAQLNAGDLNKNFELLRRGIEENAGALNALIFDNTNTFDDKYVNVTGDSMTGTLQLGDGASTGIVLTPTGDATFNGTVINSQQTTSSSTASTLTTKSYVDSSVAAVPGTDLAYNSSTRVVSSSTGTDATLPEVAAGGDSGLLTGADKTKLDGIETGATADQTDAEIKTAYENNADTNAYTDAEKTKLTGIETGATADQTAAEIKTLYESNADTNEFSDAEQTKLAAIEASATADQTGAEIKALYEVEANAFTDAQFTKLAGIETAATADQTGAEIKALYEAEANAYTDAKDTKLSGIETGATADQTATEILTAVKTVDGAGSGLDADLLDGQEGSYYLNYNNLTNAPSSGLWTSSGNDVYYNSGLVGIGTTSPQSECHINTSGAGSAFYHATNGSTGGSGTDGMGMGVSGTSAYVWNYESSPMLFGTSATERMRIDSSGNVGIGTSSPLSNLHISNSGNGTARVGGNSSTLGLLFDYDQAADTIAKITSNPTYTSNNAKLHICVDGNNNQNQLVLTGAGNVGIGLSNPGDYYPQSNNLVVGTTSGNRGISVVSATTGTGSLVFADGTGNFENRRGQIVYDHSTDSLELFTDQTERLRIDSSGRLGVGTSSPFYKVHLEGSAPYVRTKNTSAPTDEKTWDFNAGTDGILRFRNTNDASSSSNNWLEVERNGVETNSIRLLTASGSERMRIKSTGHVNIGTTIDGYVHYADTFTIGDSSHCGMTIRSGTASRGSIYFADATNGTGEYAGYIEYNHNADHMRLATAAGERMRILSDGTIATGGLAATPSTVAAGSYIQHNANAGFFGNNGDAKFGSSANNPVLFQVNGSEKVRIDTSGSVGIGLTNPGDYHANANSLVSSGGITLANTTMGSIFFADSATGTGEYVGQLNYDHGSDFMQFIVNNGERMRINSDGTITTSADASINSLTVGLGNGGVTNNTALGNNALAANVNGGGNVAAGYAVLAQNTSGGNNTAAGYGALNSNTTGSSNVAVGLAALERNTTASYNVAVGTSAAGRTTTGSHNTACGMEALYNNTTASGNTAFGSGTLYVNTTGPENSAFGYRSLHSNTTGYANTGIGYLCLYSNTTGHSNLATGVQALYNNLTGTNNVAVGLSALQANTTGSHNTSVGAYSLVNNTTGWANVAAGQQALNANTTGIQNTALGYQSLYTSTTANYNTGVGYHALYSTTTGSQNTAMGRDTMLSNTTGHSNTAVGISALQANTTGIHNSAFGRHALLYNTTGIYNTAIGAQALNTNTTGNYNSSLGFQSMFYNTTGSYHVVMGMYAAHYNTTGLGLTAIGYQAAFNNTTGSFSTAVGDQALVNNTTGQRNTAIGNIAGRNNTTGSYNNSFGDSANADLTTGLNNTSIGVQNSSGYAPVFNVTTHSNRFVCGHTSITNAYVKVAWTVTSDERDKMNFASVPHGLDFVNQLKPTAFQFKVDRDTEEPNGDVRYGFKAQDILALEGDNPVIIDAEDPDHLKYKGEHLVPVLVNAVQELTAMVKELQTEIKTLKG